jgi:transketolase
MKVIVPCDSVEAYKATVAIAKIDKPFYLRLTREKTPIMTEETAQFAIGKAYVMNIPKGNKMHEAGIIGCGPILYEALKASRELEDEGVSVTVANMHTVKPLDEDFLLRFAKDKKRIVIVEEHQKHGGLGSAIAEFLSANMPTPLEFISVDDRFGQSGTPKELYEEYGLTSEHIKEKVRKVVGRY